MAKTTKKEILSRPIKHIDITSFDSTPIIEQMKNMGFTSRELGRASEIYLKMLKERKGNKGAEYLITNEIKN